MNNVNDKKECEEHTMVEKTMDKIVALAKSRGFVYPGSEIYGGLANTWIMVILVLNLRIM